MKQDSRPFSIRVTAAIMVFAIVFLGLSLRIVGLQRQSLSNDEILEIEIARSPVSELLVAKDGFPPLYHLILKAWLYQYREDSSARYLSALFGVLVVVAVMLLAPTQDFLRRAGWWLAFLVAVSPFHLWYSREVRAYVLYLLLATLATSLFLRGRASDSAVNWAAFAFVSILGLLTHYYFAIFVGVSFLIVVFDWRRLGRATVPLMAYGAVFLVGIFELVWILPGDLGFQESTGTQTLFGPLELGYTYFVFLVGYCIGPSVRELHTLAPGDALIQALPWVVMVGLVSSFLIAQSWSVAEAKERRRLAELAVWSVGTVIAGGLVSRFAQVGFKPHYVLAGLPPLLAILAFGAATCGRQRIGKLALASLLCVFFLSLYNRSFNPRYQVEDTRGAAIVIEQTVGQSFPVAVLSGYMVESMNYYLGNDREIVPLPSISESGDGLERCVSRVDSLKDSAGGFWLVYSRTFHGDPKELLRRTLESEGKIELVKELAGVLVFRSISPEEIIAKYSPPAA